jgi:hypothetical protein
VVDIPIGKVQSGQYDIWVGTFAPAAEARATLVITERSVEATHPHQASQEAQPLQFTPA